MKKGKLYHFSKFFLCLIFLQGSALSQDTNPANNPANNKTTKPQISEESLIHFGDLVEIDVIGSFEYDWRGRLTPEGFLDGVEFVDSPVYGLCQTESYVADKITAYYSKFLREPKIAVKILDRSNRPVSILSGAVKTPQRFQIKRPIHLNELLIISGGLTDKASGEIQIFRPEKLNCLAEVAKIIDSQNPKIETSERFVAAREDNGSRFINIKIIDLLTGKDEANPQILSGDIVSVLESQPIYVIGGVENPKQISSRSEISLTRAIASAGGLSKDADETKITIFRREANETKIIEADLQKIKAEQSEDIILQPFDIIEVARRGKQEKKNPPILENFDSINKDKLKLPLRIID
jgi:protein involved in polysaccharide export with SLBB domain